ncbi:MAG: ATP-binding protein [Alphaproteobacteria bacterium]|nr:ATP-binding protein [Alphaproteobacteria bacterium]
MKPLSARSPDASLVAVERFILATRDSGYRSTPSAVAELVDNAIQAEASRILIRVERDPTDRRWPLRLSVQDDGVGMDAAQLRQALRFGGSARFDDRRGLGRYGMGLPNSSLSQARRLEVLTWRRRKAGLFCYLDVDEIAAGDVVEVPPPLSATLQDEALDPLTPRGTRVTWRRCDRLDFKRASTIAKHLCVELGRIFRHFIWEGLDLRVNGEPVVGVDPLFLHPAGPHSGATAYGAPLRYELRAANGEVGEVVVTFAELPVAEWHDLPNAEKSARGIVKGAGLSVVRAGREIDRGWMLFGAKRRENYDDWWRCELRFEPCLDEHFGITHTKQQARPSQELVELLSRDMEAAARALYGRARRAHEQAKLRRRLAAAERAAAARERRLASPTLSPLTEAEAQALARLAERVPGLLASRGDGMGYRLVIDTLASTRLFEVFPTEALLIVAINSAHPFYRKLYLPLLEGGRPGDEVLRARLDLLVLAAARAEVASDAERPAARALRQVWSDVLSEFLKDEVDG